MMGRNQAAALLFLSGLPLPGMAMIIPEQHRFHFLTGLREAVMAGCDVISGEQGKTGLFFFRIPGFLSRLLRFRPSRPRGQVPLFSGPYKSISGRL